MSPLSCFACVDSTGAEIEISGSVALETFAGPPNFESIEKGDRPETYWILTSQSDICVEGYSEPQTRFQLFSLKGPVKIEEEEITIRGITMEGHTGHHHTNILIEVND